MQASVADSRLVHKGIMIIVVAEVTVVLNFFAGVRSSFYIPWTFSSCSFSFAHIDFVQLKVQYVTFEWIAATQN